jgi:hypothetical protein
VRKEEKSRTEIVCAPLARDVFTFRAFAFFRAFSRETLSSNAYPSDFIKFLAMTSCWTWLVPS